MLGKSIFGIVLSAAGLVSFHGCSVEAGKIPTAAAVLTPEGEFRARTEIKSSLSEIQSTVALVGRVQSVIQRGLAEHNIDSGEVADPAFSLFVPSDADALTFDKDHPEKFEYRLNNSASVSLKTKSGGRLDIVLAGTLDDLGDHFTIRDAKLEVIHERNANRQVFQILVEKKTDQNGVMVTNWLVDFSQLSELYREMGGKEESRLAAMNGTLAVRLSSDEVTVSAKDLSMIYNNVRLAFDVVDVNVSNVPDVNGQKPRKIVVSGHVDEKGTRIGEFSISHQSADAVGELKVDFRF